MDWLVRSLFDHRDSIELLPGLVLRVGYEVLTTSEGVNFVVERFRVVCSWFPW
jgi:hypothetical protein